MVFKHTVHRVFFIRRRKKIKQRTIHTFSSTFLDDTPILHELWAKYYF